MTVTRCRGGAGAFFVNGRLAGAFVPRVGSLVTNAPLLIGRSYPIVITTRRFNGCIDELEITRAALPQADIAAIFNAGQNGKCKNAHVTPGRGSNVNQALNRCSTITDDSQW